MRPRERAQDSDHLASDVAGADDADDGAGQVLLAHRYLGRAPAAGAADVQRVLHQALGAHDDEPQRGLGHVVGDRHRGRGHADAARDDVLRPHPVQHAAHRSGRVGDDPQPVGRLHDRGRDRRRSAGCRGRPAGDEGIVAADQGADLRLGQVAVALVAGHLESALQARPGGGGEYLLGVLAGGQVQHAWLAGCRGVSRHGRPPPLRTRCHRVVACQSRMRAVRSRQRSVCSGRKARLAVSPGSWFRS